MHFSTNFQTFFCRKWFVDFFSKHCPTQIFKKLFEKIDDFQSFKRLNCVDGINHTSSVNYWMGPVMHSTHRFRKKRSCIRGAFHDLKKGIFKHVNIQSFVDPNPIEFNMSKIWTLTRFVVKHFPTNFMHVFGFQQIPFKHLFENLLKKVSDKIYTHKYQTGR